MNSDPLAASDNPSGAGEPAMAAAAKKTPKKTPKKTTTKKDQPYFDPVAYGNGPDDSVAATEADENAAVTHHSVTVGGAKIAYTATVGHLVTVDPSSSKPDAKMFYVAFTKDGAKEEARPLTFFYNGGPGSSSVFVLLGSFAPRRIKTAMPGFTPPAPYEMEDNPDSLLDRSDLIFINPVGTGYSAAIAPNKNRDFWGVDQDAGSIAQFIKRYLTKNNRWNSPKFLFGESYGTARSCVLAYKLHEDGIDLNGVTLQSSILDYAQAGNPVGALPTAAADAWYHKKLGVHPTPTSLVTFAEEVAEFARTDYLNALRKFPQTDDEVVEKLGLYGHRQGDAACVESRHRRLRQPRQFALSDDASEIEGRIAWRLRWPRDGDIDGHRGQDRPELGRQRSDDDSGERRLYDDVEQLSERAVEVHFDVLVHGSERSGVPELGLQAYRSDGRAEGHRFEGQHHPVHGGRSRCGDGVEYRSESVVRERDV